MDSQHDISPLVSIIMPTYNRAKYIGDTVASIQAQIYTNWELLIVDDGSEDDTETIITSINDSRITYINNGRIGIVGNLKNEGLRLSKGEFIAFMDSDDLWPKEKLTKQVEALKEYPIAGFSFTNWQDFEQPNIFNTPPYNRIEGKEQKNIFTEFAKGKLSVSIATILMRKTCLNKVRGFNVNRIFTDFSFIGKLAHHYEVVVLYEPLFYRRLHEANNTSTNWKQDYEEYQETALDFVKRKWIKKSEVYPSLFKCYINLGERLLAVKHYKLAINNYIKSWRYKPISIIPMKKVLKAVLLYCRFL